MFNLGHLISDNGVGADGVYFKKISRKNINEIDIRDGVAKSLTGKGILLYILVNLRK